MFNLDNWDNDYIQPTFDVQSIHQSNGFCPDQACPCHSDSELIGELQARYEAGELTAEESEFVFKGGFDGFLDRGSVR